MYGRVLCVWLCLGASWPLGAFADNPAVAESFWHYFEDESRHSFYAAGTEADAFAVPPWETDA